MPKNPSFFLKQNEQGKISFSGLQRLKYSYMWKIHLVYYIHVGNFRLQSSKTLLFSNTEKKTFSCRLSQFYDVPHFFFLPLQFLFLVEWGECVKSAANILHALLFHFQEFLARLLDWKKACRVVQMYRFSSSLFGIFQYLFGLICRISWIEKPLEGFVWSLGQRPRNNTLRAAFLLFRCFLVLLHFVLPPKMQEEVPRSPTKNQVWW